VRKSRGQSGFGLVFGCSNIPYCKGSSLVLRAVVFRLFLGIADREALSSNRTSCIS
jgi:hypothetical protein